MNDNNVASSSGALHAVKHRSSPFRRAGCLLESALLAGILGLTSAQAAVTIQKVTDEIKTPTNSWSYLVMEAESFEIQADDNPDAGFARVDKSSGITSFLGNQILGANSTASGGAALYTKT